MTISYVSNAKAYLGDGITQSFATVMPFFANAHLVVTLQSGAGAVVPQIEGVDYSLVGAGNNAGGTLTMTLAPPAGSTLTITRTVPLIQLVDYVPFDQFPAEATEDAFDYLTMIAQQQQAQIANITAGGGGGGMGAANIGGSGAGIYAGTVSGVLQFKKLVPGTNVALVDSGSDITIQVFAPGVSYPGTFNTVLRGDGTFTNVLGTDVDVLHGLEFHTGDSPSDYPTALSFYNAAGSVDGKWYGFWQDAGASDNFSLSMFPDAGPYVGPSIGYVFSAARTGNVLTSMIFGRNNAAAQELEFAFGFTASQQFDNTTPGVYMTGNLQVFTTPGSTTGPRFMADLGNPINKLRLCFQTSTVNGATGLNLIPNGTGTISAVVAANTSDPDNAGLTILGAGGIPTLRTVGVGTGVAQPVTIAVASTVAFTIVTPSGRVCIGAGSVDDGINGVQVGGANNLNIVGGVLKIGNKQVVAARDTGWAMMTGTFNKASIYDTSTVTLAQLASRVAQLQFVLAFHGMIGP